MLISQILNPRILGKYSLILIKDDKIIYCSHLSGIRPLIYCIEKYYSCLKDCILYDKVVGLAAAKLIVYSQMITTVITSVVSKNAQSLLQKNKIHLEAQKIVSHILQPDKHLICPLEIQALNIDDHTLFFQKIKKSLKKQKL